MARQKKTAEEQPTPRKPRGRGRPFQKGQSGNPNGRQAGVPNKVTVEVREWARAILEDPLVQARTLEQAQEGKLAPAIWTALLQYAYGKPKDTLELQGKDGGPVTISWLDKPPKPSTD